MLPPASEAAEFTAAVTFADDALPRFTMNASKSNLRLDYIEFATRDVAAARRFYTAAFDWVFTDDGSDYTRFTDGRLNGGFVASPDVGAKTNPLAVVFADDLEAAEQRVKDAGGKILRPASDFNGGRRFHFADPTGLELAVWSHGPADGTLVS